MKLALQKLGEWFSHPRDRELVAYLNEELGDRRRRRVARHLSECNRCRFETAGYAETLELLRRRSQPVSFEEGLAALRASISDYQTSQRSSRHRGVSLPTLVMIITAVHLAIAFFTWMQWVVTGNPRWITLFFQYQGDLFFVAFSALEVAFCIYIRRKFSRDDPLRPAWFMILLAAVCHLIGALLSHLLGWNPAFGPYTQTPSLWYNGETANSFYQFGLVVSGPLHMLLLAIGLFLVIRSYKKRGLLVRLAWTDHTLLGAVVFYSLYSLVEILTRTADSAAPVSMTRILSWTSDPLLSLLLFEAVFIRRSVVRMNSDLMAKCWGAFTVAILLTLLGDVGLWTISHGYFPWPLNSLTWYVWFFASAAYVLAPAYQIEAMRRAREENVPAVGERQTAFAPH